jgi:hypothetical protein
MEQQERQKWEAGKRKASAPRVGPGHARVIIDLPRILARRDLSLLCAGHRQLLVLPKWHRPCGREASHTLSW